MSRSDIRRNARQPGWRMRKLMQRHYLSLLMVLALANCGLAIAAGSTSSAGGGGGSGASGSSGSSGHSSGGGGGSSAGAGHGSFAGAGGSYGGHGFGARGAAQASTAHQRAVTARQGPMPGHPGHHNHRHFAQSDNSASRSAFHEWANHCLDSSFEQETAADPFNCRHATKAPVDSITGVPIG
jgi:hypothetical protein